MYLGDANSMHFLHAICIPGGALYSFLHGIRTEKCTFYAFLRAIRIPEKVLCSQNGGSPGLLFFYAFLHVFSIRLKTYAFLRSSVYRGGTLYAF